MKAICHSILAGFARFRLSKLEHLFIKNLLKHDASLKLAVSEA